MFSLNKIFQNKTYVLADQALVSLLNFGSIFLISKFASISVFANFVLAYGYSNLIFILVTYFLTGPVLVFLPKKEEKEAPSYLASLILLNVVFALLLSLIAFPFVQTQVENIGFLSFLGINLSMIIYDLFKKFFFAQNKVSFIYTVISSIVLVSIFFGIIFFYRNSLNLNIILSIYVFSFIMGTAVLLITMAFKGFLKGSAYLPTAQNLKKVIGFLQEHYIYSKWIAAAGILFWTYSQGIFIMADLLGVTELGIAKVRSIQNLLGLFTILLVSMESFFIPVFSRNVSSLAQIVKEFYSKYAVIIALIFLLSIPVFYGVYHYFYLDKFGNGNIIMIILWLSQLVVVFLRPLSMALKAKEISYPLFLAHLVALTSLILLGSLFMYLWADIGMSMALFMAYFSSNLTILYYYKKYVTA